MDDTALLQEYARTGAETAFATLVERHVGLVYSAARRQLRDPQLAEDVTQAVFIVLARKAGRVARHPGLSGWLLQTTRYAANAHIRAAVRRTQREQEAAMQSELNNPTPDFWAQLEPHLDEAMSSLGATDRAVLALRYFENKTAAEIGQTLKLNEEAAKKRANRALEKLRKFFWKKGIALSVGAIAASVSSHSVQAAPAGLAVKISAVAGKSLATTTITTLAKETMKTMTWNNIRTMVAIGAGIILAAGTTTLFAQHSGKAVAQIPYKMLEDACRFQDGINPTNLAFRFLITSKNQHVRSEHIHLTIQSTNTGKIAVQLGAKGQIINFPQDEDLRRENPFVVSDQPKGSLNLGVWVYVPMPDGLTFHYRHLSNAVEEMNKAEARANQMVKSDYPGEGQFMSGKVDGVGLVFGQSSAHKAKIVIATSAGAKEYVADGHGIIKLRINPKLQAENPLVTVSEKPDWIGIGQIGGGR